MSNSLSKNIKELRVITSFLAFDITSQFYTDTLYSFMQMGATPRIRGVSQVIHSSPSLSDMCQSKARANKGGQFNDTGSVTITVERE